MGIITSTNRLSIHDHLHHNNEKKRRGDMKEKWRKNEEKREKKKGKNHVRKEVGKLNGKHERIYDRYVYPAWEPRPHIL